MKPCVSFKRIGLGLLKITAWKSLALWLFTLSLIGLRALFQPLTKSLSNTKFIGLKGSRPTALRASKVIWYDHGMFSTELNQLSND
jgi:hypothetical protein